jgi:hypothetical protein
MSSAQSEPTRSASSERRRFRFGLRAIFIAFISIAVLLTIASKVWDWYFAVPTIPLADAVAFFNKKSREDSVGRQEPPMTEGEVIAAITAQLPTLAASNQVKAIYSAIVRTKRIPITASLDSIPGFSPASGKQLYTVWWVNLDIRPSENSGYALRVRENDSPRAKPASEPKLTRSDQIRLPELVQPEAPR